MRAFRRAAPAFRVHVADRFGEIPSVAVEVLRVVLALAIGMLDRPSENGCASLASTLAMGEGIFDADLDETRLVGRIVALADRQAPFTGAHLDAVIADT